MPNNKVDISQQNFAYMHTKDNPFESISIFFDII